jgi:hypothetical protein
VYDGNHRHKTPASSNANPGDLITRFNDFGEFFSAITSRPDRDDEEEVHNQGDDHRRFCTTRRTLAWIKAIRDLIKQTDCSHGSLMKNLSFGHLSFACSPLALNQQQLMYKR